MATETRLSRRQKRELRKSEGNCHIDNKFSMRRIIPLTETQEQVFNAYYENLNIAAIGTAGTGKSFIALYLALTDVLENSEYDRVIIIRSAVQTRDQGYMPGSLKEKEAYYEAPYAIIIVDECQSMTMHELDSIMTRVGENSRIIFCGDTKQDDLVKSKYDTSGLATFLRVINNMRSFAKVTFKPADVVRSGVVKEYILTKEMVDV
jgi:phosphate starvation-inducible protein PhoH